MCLPGREMLHKIQTKGQWTLQTRLWIPVPLGLRTGEVILSGPSLRGRQMVCAPQGCPRHLSRVFPVSHETYVCDLSLVFRDDSTIRWK